jgi:thioredoxin reductase
MRRLAVIGAGPIGLAAAIGAHDRGFDVTVFEAGEVGASPRSWGATRFFTPFVMNVTPRMTELLGHDAPAADAILTGPEYAEAVLRPLVEREPLRGRVRTNTRVVSVARRGLTRSDYAGHPLRAEKPFRVVTSDDEMFEFDAVLDATGNTSIPLPFAARRERNVQAIRTLGELDARKDSLRAKRVLVAGHGHSAANALAVLHEIGAEIIWAVRTPNRRPCAEIASDPLPERQRVVAFANDLAPSIRVERRATIEDLRVARTSVRAPSDHGAQTEVCATPEEYEVTLTGNRTVTVDAIVALTGYRPSNDFISELALEISPVTEGNARLWRAISNITDCLCTPAVAPQDLATGEANYFFIGARAYGRSRTFLLQTGFAQVDTILESLHD